nr:nucleotide-binding alpha-beta plait domain-containing protein [Tanacetum cinerariifolium]
MGIFRTKKDEVSKISTSIFVSNFLDSFSSKDLFHACKQYGHVVDSFIPSKRAKDGKRFGFVRFINVFSVERLGSGMSLDTKSTLTIVLDDECLNTKDLSCSLMGRVKEFTSLSNLKKVLCNEGFDVLKISYLGELWVLIEFESAKQTRGFRFLIKRLRILLWEGELLGWKLRVFPLNSGQFIGCVQKKVPGWTLEFTEEEEKDDVSVEDNHGGIHSDQEINNCNDVSDVEEVPDTCFNVPECQKGNPSEDPFGIYPLLNKDKNIREHKINEEESSLKYPLGFTLVWNLNEGHLDGGCAKKVNKEVAGDYNSFVHTFGGKENSGSVNKMSDSMGSCRLKKSGMPRTGGSILSFMDEVVKREIDHIAGGKLRDNLLKEYTKGKSPEKVLVREEVGKPVTKNDNAIYIDRIENDKSKEGDEVVNKNIVETIKLAEKE